MDSFQEDFITGWGMIIETEPDCTKGINPYTPETPVSLDKLIANADVMMYDTNGASSIKPEVLMHAFKW
jgi:hypothetical protein